MKHNVINNLEIHFVGLQRSGNHAIINWMLDQCTEGILIFLNNISLDGNPWLTAPQKEIRLPQRIDLPTKIKTEIIKGRGVRLITRMFGTSLAQRYKSKAIDIFSPRLKKEALIYSHEDFSLKDIHACISKNIYEKKLGKSLNKHTILLLRDAPNFFASRIRWTEIGGVGCKLKLVDEESRERLIKLWKEYAKEYAKEYLGITNFLGENKFVISFNEWFTNKEYRKTIAEKIGLQFSDKGINTIAKYGPGSSFDRTPGGEGAQQIKVLGRWRHYSGNKFYDDIFKDKELVELSNEIFGKIKD